MAMLAEPRRKQKVINLRAKNNAWSNDANKFGQRMLEKMGWSAGKGLGANENGIVEHVIARYKNDDRGLGYEDKNDQWTKHEDDFNALLANLSSDKDTNPEVLHSGVSLEKKSKKSKARIHYHKFTRGKDISRYSEKDLANIFGKKSFKSENVEESANKDDEETTQQIFTEKGSMEDYFKSKMAALKSKNKITPSPIETSNENCDFAFRGFSCNGDQENSNGKNSTQENFSFYKMGTQENNQGEIENEKTDNKLKKKKSKNKLEFNHDDNKADYAFQGFSCNNATEDVKENEITEENSQPSNDNDNATEEGVLPKKNKKKKKKSKDSELNLQEEICDNNVEENVEIKKSKKKRKNKEPCLEEISQPQDNQDIYNDVESDGIPKKKKKRKNKDL